MESNLGECPKGLANVQLPSWSHADYAAYARLQKRALAAAVLFYDTARVDPESHIIQSGPAGGPADF